MGIINLRGPGADRNISAIWNLIFFITRLIMTTKMLLKTSQNHFYPHIIKSEQCKPYTEREKARPRFFAAIPLKRTAVSPPEILISLSVLEEEADEDQSLFF